MRHEDRGEVDRDDEHERGERPPGRLDASEIHPASRAMASPPRSSETRTRRRPPPALRGAPPCRGGRGAPRRRLCATPTAKNVRSAATRWRYPMEASASSPRLPEATPDELHRNRRQQPPRYEAQLRITRLNATPLVPQARAATGSGTIAIRTPPAAVDRRQRLGEEDDGDRGGKRLKVAASVARAARMTPLNHSSFVRGARNYEGEEEPDGAAEVRSFWSRSCGIAVRVIGTEASPRTTALTWVAECRMSGTTRGASRRPQVAAVITPRSTPPRSPRARLRAERDERDTGEGHERAEPEARWVASVAAAIPSSPAKIGVAPSRIPSTEAVVRSRQ